MNRRQVQESARRLQEDKTAQGASKLNALLRGTLHTKPSSIPGSDIDFVFRVLSGHDKQAVLGNACKRFDELGIPVELRHYNDLEDEMTWQILAMAMRDPDHKGSDANPYPKPLATVDECREKLTPDERDSLISEYMDLEEQVDPDPMNVPDEWFEAVTGALKKKAPERARALNSFGSRILTGYMDTMADQLLNSLSGKSGTAPFSGENSSDSNSEIMSEPRAGDPLPNPAPNG